MPRVSNQKTAALTRVEVVITVSVIVFLVIVIFACLPVLKEKAKRVNCYNYLRAAGGAFWIWAGDNHDKFPMELSTNQGGAREPLLLAKVSEVFLVMSNELCTPRVLCCPADSRIWATNWGQFDNQHLSYFVGVDTDCNRNLADASMTKFLFGDRNLTSQIETSKNIFQFSASQDVRWTTELHDRRGNICLANGAVLEVNNSGIHNALQATGVATNLLAIP